MGQTREEIEALVASLETKVDRELQRLCQIMALFLTGLALVMTHVTPSKMDSLLSIMGQTREEIEALVASLEIKVDHELQKLCEIMALFLTGLGFVMTHVTLFKMDSLLSIMGQTREEIEALVASLETKVDRELQRLFQIMALFLTGLPLL
ncbi:hypothetical protein NL676_005543 [Syzygium grande]|nr:hypothetical protein NL676_005543 [Syzygium grande]